MDLSGKNFSKELGIPVDKQGEHLYWNPQIVGSRELVQLTIWI